MLKRVTTSFLSFQVNMMSAQMLSSMSNTSAPAMAMADDMKMLEAQATAASSVAATASSEAKQNISFVRGESQSKAVEEAQSQQVSPLS
jgi:hypothetical protein